MSSIKIIIATACLVLVSSCGGGGGGSHPASSVFISSVQTFDAAGSSQDSVSSSSALSSLISESSSDASSVSSANESSISSSNVSSFSSIASSIVASASSSSFASASYGDNVVIIDDSISGPLIEVGNVSYSPIVDESVFVDWFAEDSSSPLTNVQWNQVSGPATTITVINPVLLKIQSHAAGTVVLEGTATNGAGQSSSVQLQYNVQVPFSSKAKLLKGRSDGKGIDLIIVGDGFTRAQQADLLAAALSFQNKFFSYDNRGIGTHSNLWNVWQLDSESITDVIPRDASGSTLFGSYFNCNGIDRLLCVDTDKVTSYVSVETPQFDQILVAVNSSAYGGAGYTGNRIATFSLSNSAEEVAIHELGHAFAGLGDEYEMNDNQATLGLEDYPDLTLVNAPSDAKWKAWIENLTTIAGIDRSQNSPTEVGFFEGGGYHATGVWRPTFTSLMRDLGQPLGSVNSESWAINAWRNAPDINIAEIAKHQQNSSTIRVYHLPTIVGSNLQEITWKINGVAIDSAKNKNFLVTVGDSHSTDVIGVILKDNTGLIRVNPSGAGAITYTLHAQ